jgi:hypothetical protein
VKIAKKSWVTTYRKCYTKGILVSTAGLTKKSGTTQLKQKCPMYHITVERISSQKMLPQDIINYQFDDFRRAKVR